MMSDLEFGENKFMEMLKQAEIMKSCNFIITENASKLKSHEYDEWYKEFVQSDMGIWIGNGMSNQYVIKTNMISNDIINNCGNSFGYVVTQGEPTLIKLIGIEGED